jgi:ElaB/YqjD/DUF883 family membrane-anchored ribosome-binding protein
MTKDPVVRRRTSRRPAIAAVAAACLLALGACGDDGDDAADDEGSGEAAVCEARDELDSSFAALGDVDIVNDGTDALRDAVEAITDDVDALADAAGDEAGDEVAAVSDTFEALLASVGEIADGDSPGSGASAVGAALTDFGEALGDLAVALQTECG